MLNLRPSGALLAYAAALLALGGALGGCSSEPSGQPGVEACGEACLESGHCDDGLDNDDDGLVDCEDDDCHGDLACWSYGLECATATIATFGPGPWLYRGDLPDSASVASGSCGGAGPELVLSFTAPTAGTYQLEARSPHNPLVLYVRKGLCMGRELACDAGSRAQVSVNLRAEQTAVVFVDSEADRDSFTLEITPPPPAPPSCTGVVRCGVGACARELPACAGGVPQTCTPGQPSPETCDGFDNDCNGAVDDAPGCAELPPDPSTVAPPLDPTVVPAFGATVDFLYTGDHPIQRGVRAGTIDAERVAVLHGHAGDQSGAHLGGARVSVHGRPELGFTLTRADGNFDLVVNGGGVMVVDFERDGYFAVQRQATVPWHEHVYLDDAVLVAPDRNVTIVDLASSMTVQVAEGSPVTDRDGTRRATVLIPPGTSADLLMPDGTRRPIASLSVRATEYTVGPTGPAAMPAKLPPTSAYTYAVELSADEALAAGAEHVVFSQPVPLYVDNFLHFPVGTGVPAGYYDRRSSAWVPLDNGLVIGVTGVGANGEAALDLDGDGASGAADAALEASLGLDGAEKMRLAELYQAGQSVWRTRIPHFTTVDLNWAGGVPAGTTGPDQPTAFAAEYEVECCEQGGSIVQAQNRSVGEELPIFGTPFTLVYDSSRVLGRKDGIDIPLIGATVPPNLSRVDLTVYVAGRVFRRSFTPRPNLQTRFSWDNRDVYGRVVSGPPWINIQVGFVYPAKYNTISRFAAVDGTYHTQVPGREELVLERSTNLQTALTTGLPTVDARVFGFGGFSLSGHHLLNKEAGVLIGGHGKARHAVVDVVDSMAGPGDGLHDQDGAPAVSARVNPRGLAFDSAGDLYIADASAGVVRKVDRAGVITTVAGGVFAQAQATSVGDGGPATQASLVYPGSVAVDGRGNLYIAESAMLIVGLENGYDLGFGWLNRIRRVTPDGRIETIAGGFGPGCIAGDHVAAVGACLPSASALDRGPHLAVDATGHVFVGGQTEIRRIDPDGLISTVAGGPHAGFGGEWSPAAADYSFGRIDDLTVDSAGNLFVADDGNRRIRRIDAKTWTVSTVVGCGPVCVPSARDRVGVDGACRPPSDYPADSAAQELWGCTRDRLGTSGYLGLGPNQETSIAATLGGALYVRSKRPHRERVSVWRLGEDGADEGDVIGGAEAYDAAPHTYPDGADPVTEDPNDILDLAVSPKGELVLARREVVRRLRRTSTALVPALDGSAFYRFDGSGRHLETLNRLTGTTRLTFGYDPSSRLIRVTDGDGNVTRIDRDSAGRPTQIVAPAGQVTRLSVNPQGYLAELTDPTGATYRMTYHGDGLLETFTKPSGATSQLTYDEFGSLRADTNSAGGGWASLERAGTSESSTVTLTSQSARVTRYVTSSDGERSTRETDLPDGSVATRVVERDQETLRMPDGTIIRSTKRPDPELGRLVPVVEEQVMTLPSGRQLSIAFQRELVRAPAGGAGTARVTEITRVNGQPFTRVYDGASRTWTQTSPMGRRMVTALDAQERTIERSLPGQAPIRFTYDAQGKLATVTRASGGEAQTLGLEYPAAGPAAGYLGAVINTVGDRVTYARDARGAVTQVTSPEGRALLATYDTGGNLATLAPPGRTPHSFSWTSRDLLERIQPPAVGPGDPAISFTHGLDDQLLEVSDSGGVAMALAYGPGGEVARITTPEGVLPFTYDAAGRVTSASCPSGATQSYGYDGPLVTSAVSTGPSAGEVSYAYDDNMRLVADTVTTNGHSDTLTFAYDADGLLIEVGRLRIQRDPDSGKVVRSLLGGVTEELTYDGFGRVSGYGTNYQGRSLYVASYRRDRLDRIVEEVETIDGVSTTRSYEYDRDGRLIAVETNGARTAEYHYDDNGNRLSVDQGSRVRVATYDAQDRLVSYDGDTFSYAPAGELRSRTTASGDTTSYTYDALGNLRSVRPPRGSGVEYLVDAAGRRIGKLVDGIRTQTLLYGVEATPLAELDAAGDVLSRFAITGAGSEYMMKAGRTYAVIRDIRGSVRLVVDADDGRTAQRLDYDAWGQVLADSSPGFQPFGFAGGLYDPGTGLVRFGARDYDPSVGRWTAKDPIFFDGGDTNLYAYVGNDPIDRVDPTGLILSPYLGQFLPSEKELFWEKKPYYEKLDADPNVYAVGGHGNPWAAGGWGPAGLGQMQAKELAQAIRNEGIWTEGMPIVLLGCNTGKGKNSVAEQLARELGVPVTAPNTFYAPTADTFLNQQQVVPIEGKPYNIYVPAPDGKFVTFYPPLNPRARH